MNFQKYYEGNVTYIVRVDDRLQKIMDLVLKLHPKNLLDIGCGRGTLLNELLARGFTGKVYGLDVYPKPPRSKYRYKKADITEGLPYPDSDFECVILGEVIEHVPNTDFILREINRILKKGGVLIISTPNLVCWLNRIIVPMGIQPLFSETSSEKKFGRVWEKLGQGRKSEGHLKIFTHRSLSEILEYTGFRVIKKMGVLFFFPFPLSLLDKIFVNFVPMSSGLLYVAQKVK